MVTPVAPRFFHGIQTMEANLHGCQMAIAVRGDLRFGLDKRPILRAAKPSGDALRLDHETVWPRAAGVPISLQEGPRRQVCTSRLEVPLSSGSRGVAAVRSGRPVPTVDG
jgi:hypothetical protein